MLKRKFIYVIAGFLMAAFLLVKLYQQFEGPNSSYLEPEPIAFHENGNGYLGSSTCMDCHKDIYESHILTPHFNTSFYPSIKNIKGTLEDDGNPISLMDATISIEETNDQLFQNAQIVYGDRKEYHWSMDIAIGSGIKGQSYLTQQPEGLFQLQGSYFIPTNSWINSPNYTKKLNPLRPVNDQCLKCHVTFAKNLGPSSTSNSYDITKMVMGIDCEKCHGPGQKHVTHYRNNLNGILDTTLVKINTLTRQQRLDICATCHSGLRNNQIKNPFLFLPGDTLAKFSKNYNSLRPSANLDVHGNQYGLLTSSECFKQTNDMDCITCHNPHKNQRDNHSYFNSKCITCHSGNTMECSNTDINHNSNNCIQCHMPVIPSQSMQVQLSKIDNAEPVGVRTHYIAVYPKEQQREEMKE